MSVLFTAVSVEQQEIVAGGFLDKAVTVIGANNGNITVQKGSFNKSEVEQTIVIKRVRTRA
jgi:hypothetical protein